MAGTVTENHEKKGIVGVITLTCVGDASDGSFPNTALTIKISGKLLALETNPGTTQPTDNYDITLEDSDTHDVLEGVGANRDTANTEKAAIVYSGTAIHPPIAKSDTLTFKIANNSVNSAEVVAKIYYEGDFE